TMASCTGTDFRTWTVTSGTYLHGADFTLTDAILVVAFASIIALLGMSSIAVPNRLVDLSVSVCQQPLRLLGWKSQHFTEQPASRGHTRCRVHAYGDGSHMRNDPCGPRRWNKEYCYDRSFREPDGPHGFRIRRIR